MRKKQVKRKANIRYVGRLRVTTMDGHNVVSVKEYHNAGTDQLFRFLCLCLCGEYRDAEKVRPFKIKLYDRTDQYDPASWPVTNQDNAASGFISVSKPATYNKLAGAVAATLHFTVPYSRISGDRICQVCLYGADKGNGDEDQFSAYYYFADDKKVKWKPITIDNTHKANYSLIIEWTLSFENVANA